MPTQNAHRRALLIVFVGLALALAGCGGSASPTGAATVRGGATPGSTMNAATATPIPVPMLAWRQVGLPASTVAENGGAAPPSDGFAFSPANGHIMWACTEPTRGTYEILRSRYDTTTWQMMSMLTPTAPLATTGCFLRADDDDPNTLEASFNWGTPNSVGPTGLVSYFSTDAGAHWNRLPSDVFVGESATLGGVTYAALVVNGKQEFVVSQNHLANWQNITPTGSAPSAAGAFWIGGAGQILWTAVNSGVLYHSVNGGTSWVKVPMPSAGGVETVAAQWNAQAGTWLACGDHILATNQPHNQNYCTSNLGKTWTARDDLTETWECKACGQNATPSHGVNPCSPSMMTANGALLAICGNDPQDTVTTPTSFNWTLSWLAPGATAWTTVGGVPCTTASLTQTGQLYCAGYNMNIYTLDSIP